MTQDFAIQSYCFRNFKDHSVVAGFVRECGCTQIELCAAHVDFSDVSCFDRVIGTYEESGVHIVSIGVEKLGTDVEEARKRFEFVRKAGASFMSVDFNIREVPEAYGIAEKLAEEYDIRLGIHNHGGLHWLGSPSVLEHAFEQTGGRIGLSLDTAWALHSHADPVKMVQQFSERLYLLHLKDFVFDPSGSPEDVVCGSGNLDLDAMVDALKGIDFAGPAIIEYEGDVEEPVPALKKCVNKLREHWLS